MAGSVFRLVLNEAQLLALSGASDGAVARDLARRAIAVQAEASRLCPVDTGRLRGSIEWEIGKDSRGLVARVGTNVEYARFVEEGTRRMTAQPFLRPALRAIEGG